MIWERSTSLRRSRLALICAALGAVDAAFLQWTFSYPWIGWFPWTVGWGFWVFSEPINRAWLALRFLTWLLLTYSTCSYLIHMASRS